MMEVVSHFLFLLFCQKISIKYSNVGGFGNVGGLLCTPQHVFERVRVQECRFRTPRPGRLAETMGRSALAVASEGRATRGTGAGADIRGLGKQGVMEAGSKEVRDFAILQNL